jgi:hypothetical protein
MLEALDSVRNMINQTAAFIKLTASNSKHRSL